MGRTFARFAACWLPVALSALSACSDILGLQQPIAAIVPCAADEDCGPRARCEHESCLYEPCEANRARCAGGTVLRCGEDSTWEREACPAGCKNGECVTPNSCANNPLCAGDESCCKSQLIERASIELRYYYPDAASQSGGTADDRVVRDVSPFMLDRFEVTLGRFKLFYRAYNFGSRTPPEGSGAHPAYPESGWQESWSDNPNLMPGSQIGLEGSLHRNEHNLDDDPDDVPVRGVNWYVAMAFCIWDGGRLPTEAEWAYAAFGGEDDRNYPWQDVAIGAPITHELARYSDATETQSEPAAVGSYTAGQGAFAQHDMAGNLAEWVADAYKDRLDATCSAASSRSNHECLAIEDSDRHVLRGGSYLDSGELLANVRRVGMRSSFARPYVGFRCARDLEPPR
jgi:formylglycine-generating enzyme